MFFAPVFRLDLPFGRCVGVSLPTGRGAAAGEIPAAALDALHEEERRHAATLTPIRRITWVGGRLALRAALGDLRADAGVVAASAPEDAPDVVPDVVPDVAPDVFPDVVPILATPRGAPSLPAGVTGSISHKDGLAVGLAARAADGWRIGIDIERVTPRRTDISRYVLRPEERARLAPPSDPRRTPQILAAFSAKEAIYKALDPFVGRYVSFDEVAVNQHDDGSAEVALHLRAPQASPGEGPFEAQLTWLRRDDVIISTARVRRRP